MSKHPTIRIKNFTLAGTDLAELRSLKSEIFTHDCYYLDLETASPNILDLGAHIGMSSLYFYSLYPAAQIVAVEPHPSTFSLLEKNIAMNGAYEIQPLQKAIVANLKHTSIDKSDQTIPLYADPTQEWLSTASLTEGGWSGNEKTTEIRVPTTTLHHLTHTFLPNSTSYWDLVKMDIEGAEKEVLLNLDAETAARIHHLMVEAHQWDQTETKQILSHVASLDLHMIESHESHHTPKKLLLYHFSRAKSGLPDA